MSYSVKKAGVEFFIKIDTDGDLIGKAANFSALYINDATKASTNVGASFTEPADGLYMCPVTIPSTGDYTVVVANTTDGMGNVPSAVVVVNATIDDVKGAVDTLQTDMTAVLAEVDGLNGEDLTALKTTIDNIKTLIDDEDGATVNSVMEFVEKIDDALSGGSGGLAALEGYTDDIENMLVGTEFLTDGVTANPFYDATNPGVAKDSTIYTALTTLQTDITTAKDSIETKLDTLVGTSADTSAEDTLYGKVAGVQEVVDANKLTLEDAGFGLSALKDLLDVLTVNMATHDTDIKAILTDATNGLEAIKTDIMAKLDAMDLKLDTIVDNTNSANASVKGYTFI